MNPIAIAREAIRTLWTHKYLWFFGFFVAAGGGAGGEAHSGQAGQGGAGAGFPSWIIVLLGVGVVLGLGYVLMHVLSEAALIKGVDRSRAGERLGIGRGLREAGRHFGSLLVVKLCFFAASLATVGVLVAPVILGLVPRLYPVWLGAVLSIALLLPGIPWLLTLYFGYEYAMRFVALESRTGLEAMRLATRFLHGRLLSSLKLLLVAYVGQMGGGMVAFLGLIPGALVGGIVYLAAGLIPALVAFGVLGVPVVIAVVGATGAFRSSVWTLGFIHERTAA